MSFSPKGIADKSTEAVIFLVSKVNCIESNFLLLGFKSSIESVSTLEIMLVSLFVLIEKLDFEVDPQAEIKTLSPMNVNSL